MLPDADEVLRIGPPFAENEGADSNMITTDRRAPGCRRGDEFRVFLRDFLSFVFSLSLSDEQVTHGRSPSVLLPRLALVFCFFTRERRSESVHDSSHTL